MLTWVFRMVSASINFGMNSHLPAALLIAPLTTIIFKAFLLQNDKSVMDEVYARVAQQEATVAGMSRSTKEKDCWW